MSPQKKILPLNQLIEKVGALQKAGKTVVQSHGVFDLIHPGIVQHLRAAKEQGDVLVVTIIRDKDVRRGPGRPIFPEELRAENVSALSMVDFIALVDDSPPYRCLGEIKPDIFARGQAYAERDGDIHDKIFREGKALSFGTTKLYETKGLTFSSSGIINKFLDIYPEETKGYLHALSHDYSFKEINQLLNKLSGLRILLIGDGIIDEYHYVSSLGKSAKAHLVVSKYLEHEVFAGGAFAIANHVAGICDNVHLVTLLGETDGREDFIRQNLKPNVSPKFFFRPDGPTVVKKRYINQYLNQKLFEINYLNDNYISGELEAAVVDYLKSIIQEFDLVLVSDFGHGFITSRIIRNLQRHAKRLAVNTQTNAANSGYNMITKYHKPFFVCLDETELRWAAQERFADVEQVARKVSADLEAEYVIITLGKQGSIAVAGGKVFRTPIFSSKVIDTVGAGDAFFAFTAPCLARGMPLDLVGFIGNAVGALAVQIMGNKKSVEKYELLEFIHTILR